MSSAWLSVLALVAPVVVAASTTDHADPIAAPFPAMVAANPEVPPQVSAAIVALRQACAAWPLATTATPSKAGSVPKSMAVPLPLSPPSPRPPERTVREVADNPDQAFRQAMIESGIAGAVVFFVALLAFSLLRGMLISVWNWRLPIGTKSW